MKTVLKGMFIGLLAAVSLNGAAAHAVYTSVKQCIADKAVNNSNGIPGTIKFESLSKPSKCAVGTRVTFQNGGSALGCNRCQSNFFVACDAGGADVSCRIKDL